MRFCNRVAVLADGRVTATRHATPGPCGFAHPEAPTLQPAILPAPPPDQRAAQGQGACPRRRVC
ncbi:hypothetical protein [Paracoccus jiaweipingae]|uniref:hypothetical protein n=1 Tax=unclassified Paracoccus (in: a-proteobacteria) TaxID=2688777 RepID=UPI0037BCA79A